MTRSAELRALADEQDRERIQIWKGHMPKPMYGPCIGCEILVWGKYTHCSRCLRAEAERIDNEGVRDE